MMPTIQDDQKLTKQDAHMEKTSTLLNEEEMRWLGIK
jgi:hypothetical protein